MDRFVRIANQTKIQALQQKYSALWQTNRQYTEPQYLIAHFIASTWARTFCSESTCIWVDWQRKKKQIENSHWTGTISRWRYLWKSSFKTILCKENSYMEVAIARGYWLCVVICLVGNLYRNDFCVCTPNKMRSWNAGCDLIWGILHLIYSAIKASQKTYSTHKKLRLEINHVELQTIQPHFSSIWKLWRTAATTHKVNELLYLPNVRSACALK